MNRRAVGLCAVSMAFGLWFACAPFGAAGDGAGPASADAQASDGGADAPDGAPTCPGDRNTDPANCGRCGHDCLGSTCADGECVPIPFRQGLLGGSCYQPGTGEACDAIFGVAANDDRVAWSLVNKSTGHARVQSCHKASSCAAVDDHTTGDGIFNVLSVSLRPNRIYWTEAGGSSGPQYDGVYEASFDAPCEQAPGMTPCMDVHAASGPTALSAAESGFFVGLSDGVALCTSSCDALAHTVDKVVAVTITSTDRYFATSSLIEHCDNEECMTASPLAPVTDLRGLAADDTHLYWTSAAGTLSRCSLPACTDGKVIASGLGLLHGLADDNARLYFAADNGNGSIYAVAK